jgi:hypothetical protein
MCVVCGGGAALHVCSSRGHYFNPGLNPIMPWNDVLYQNLQERSERDYSRLALRKVEYGPRG